MEAFLWEIQQQRRRDSFRSFRSWATLLNCVIPRARLSVLVSVGIIFIRIKPSGRNPTVRSVPKSRGKTSKCKLIGFKSNDPGTQD
ncbi:unnamed protein product [Nesidiocoris tenuis]|uniref:Uncharacterized protein n=1 Tax=Nesidiocoris tenuis TaxID=355587 RepID=A0A6H5GY56_9HEMI|nr:unnamed protein product [Nesidiocoris tenuis]